MKPKRVDSSNLQKIIEETKRSLGEPVGWRWFVEEYWPAHNSGDYDDIDYPDQIMSCSKYFDTYDEAEEYLNSVEVERPEYKLRIIQQTCYERTERYWL